jgi:hypothetical protein
MYFCQGSAWQESRSEGRAGTDLWDIIFIGIFPHNERGITRGRTRARSTHL